MEKPSWNAGSACARSLRIFWVLLEQRLMFHDQPQTHCMGFIKGGVVRERGGRGVRRGGGVRRGRVRDKREGVVEWEYRETHDNGPFVLLASPQLQASLYLSISQRKTVHPNLAFGYEKQVFTCHIESKKTKRQEGRHHGRHIWRCYPHKRGRGGRSQIQRWTHEWGFLLMCSFHVGNNIWLNKE